MPKLNEKPKLVNRGGAGLLKRLPGAEEKPATPLPPGRGRIDDIAPQLLPLAVPIGSLVYDPDNAMLHPEKNLEAIRESILRYGQQTVLVVRKATMHVVVGNGRLQVCRDLGWTKIAASIVDMTEAEAAGYGMADNRTAGLARWNFEVVARLDALYQQEREWGMPGWSLDELLVLRSQLPAEQGEQLPAPTLSDRFQVPPFSVLDARQGYWQTRKRQWLSIGIQSELGRGEDLQGTNLASVDEAGSRGLSVELKARIEKNNGLLGFSEQARSHYRGQKPNAAPGGSPLPAASLDRDGRTQRGNGRGRPLKADEEAGGAVQPQSGTSIFDPVLCELAYRWFSPPAGRVFDPFAGGSVRGIVAAKLGREYTGVDLRPEQAAANEEQAARLCQGVTPSWVVGDAVDSAELAPGEYDFLFSCPPYADLERYSDDPRDLSTMGYDEFLEVYRAIIAAACGMLAEDRFACFVVGDVRCRKTGKYRGFPADTARAFLDAGLELYNDAVLVTAVGSLPIRVGKQFSASRKLGKTHQNVLVFVKGDAARATKNCGPVEVCEDLEAMLAGELPDA